jgi:hypothetical protein
MSTALKQSTGLFLIYGNTQVLEAKLTPAYSDDMNIRFNNLFCLIIYQHIVSDVQQDQSS